MLGADLALGDPAHGVEDGLLDRAARGDDLVLPAHAAVAVVGLVVVDALGAGAAGGDVVVEAAVRQLAALVVVGGAPALVAGLREVMRFWRDA